MPGFVHQDMVARAANIDQSAFPSARTGGGVDDDGLLGFENLLDLAQHLQSQSAKLGSTVVDGRVAHGPQNTIGHR